VQLGEVAVANPSAFTQCLNLRVDAAANGSGMVLERVHSKKLNSRRGGRLQ
jgi:hypothetical protein